MKYRGINKIVVQEYIHNPFLIDGYKFDLRIYVLITRVEPLTIFVYKEGLARFATEKYDSKLLDTEDEKSAFIHLTNYAINKKNTKFTEAAKTPESQECTRLIIFIAAATQSRRQLGIIIENTSEWKRLMSEVMDHLDLEGIDIKDLWDEIKDIIRKTILWIQPSLAQTYKSLQPRSKRMDMCFQLLGFDVLIDDYGQPWLLEVNHDPSFTTTSEMDNKVKESLIKGKLRLI